MLFLPHIRKMTKHFLWRNESLLSSPNGTVAGFPFSHICFHNFMEKQILTHTQPSSSSMEQEMSLQRTYLNIHRHFFPRLNSSHSSVWWMKRSSFLIELIGNWLFKYLGGVTRRGQYINIKDMHKPSLDNRWTDTDS